MAQRPILSTVQQARFDKWYALYPRKRARTDAEKAFKALDPDDAEVDRWIAVLKKWQLREFLNRSPSRIPYPASYLRAGQFDDEPDEKITQNIRREVPDRNAAPRPVGAIMTDMERQGVLGDLGRLKAEIRARNEANREPDQEDMAF